jgi:hypothetical protein
MGSGEAEQNHKDLRNVRDDYYCEFAVPWAMSKGHQVFC